MLIRSQASSSCNVSVGDFNASKLRSTSSDGEQKRTRCSLAKVLKNGRPKANVNVDVFLEILFVVSVDVMPPVSERGARFYGSGLQENIYFMVRTRPRLQVGLPKTRGTFWSP